MGDSFSRWPGLQGIFKWRGSPKVGSVSRHVAQHHQATGFSRDPVPGLKGFFFFQAADFRIEFLHPELSPLRIRKRGIRRLMVGVENHVEVIIGDRFAERIGVRNGSTVLKNAERLNMSLFPVFVDHLFAFRAFAGIEQGGWPIPSKPRAGLLKDVAWMVAHFFVLIFVSFYIIRDGQRMLAAIKGLSPLRDEQESRIVDKVQDVVRVTVMGNLLTALCQGIVGGIGLAIVGLPPLFWGTVMAFSSLIPVVGTALVWTPAAGCLALAGRWVSAAFLAIWGIVAVGSVDNFLRPFLMRGKGGMSPFYIFLAIIGGIQLFGLMGILYGPLILGFATVMLYIYQLEYQDVLNMDGN